MTLLVLVNPASGDRSAPAFVRDHVLPLLVGLDHTVEQTEHSGHATELICARLRSLPANSNRILDVLVAAGDGTIHEVANGLFTSGLQCTINFVLAPCGTANALYSSCFPPDGDTTSVQYRTRGLRAFLDRASPPTEMNLTKTNIYASASGTSEAVPLSSIISIVVTSTALHACILHDSEALRATHPGVERFQIAARENIARTYPATVEILPERHDGKVHIYDPFAQAFVLPPSESAQGGPLTLRGPFNYFLSTVNVDRLEPSFTITPLARRNGLSQKHGSMDVVICRPQVKQSEPARSPAEDLTSVLMAAYRDGEHVDLVQHDDVRIESLRGEKNIDGTRATPVVEYYRCGGWVWRPVEEDPAHAAADRKNALLCADGTILQIPSGGYAECLVVIGDGERSIRVWA